MGNGVPVAGWSAMVRCIDGRLNRHLHQWMEDVGVLDWCDPITEPGSSRPLVHGPEIGGASLEARIMFAKQAHNIGTVHLVHHGDCAAYGGARVFKNKQEEIAVHAADMEKAAKVIRRIADVQVRLLWFDLEHHEMIEL